MTGASPLARGFGSVIGSGPGRGMGLVFILMGATIVLAATVGLLTPFIKKVEEGEDR